MQLQWSTSVDCLANWLSTGRRRLLPDSHRAVLDASDSEVALVHATLLLSPYYRRWEWAPYAGPRCGLGCPHLHLQCGPEARTVPHRAPPVRRNAHTFTAGGLHYSTLNSTHACSASVSGRTIVTDEPFFA